MFIYLLEGIKDIYGLVRNGWIYPKFTYKVRFIIFTITLFFIIFIYIGWPIILYDDLLPVIILVVDKLLSPLIALFVLALNIPKSLYSYWITQKARLKIRSLKNLIVIGITGSVGKTSTKEFLAKILEVKYKVQQTPESLNTQIGIARYILSELKSNTEVFIIEMGAYKRGEIKAICDMVHPKIGIITYIGTQHLELFGSLQNLIDAKFELIESLPIDGLAVLNGDNTYCRALAQQIQPRGLKVLMYGSKTKNLDIFANDIHTFTSYIRFNVTIKKATIRLSSHLLGKQVIPNLLAAIVIADSQGISFDEIRGQIARITPPKHTLELIGQYKGANLIDDTFNASRESVLSALDYMSIHKGKKILVLSHLIELGSEEKSIKEEVMKKAKSICDLIILTGEYNPSMVKDEVDQLVNKESVIVFEGKEAKKYLEYIREYIWVRP